ncbi:unnamed protein product, partial [Urochloa humidicola]
APAGGDDARPRSGRGRAHGDDEAHRMRQVGRDSDNKRVLQSLGASSGTLVGSQRENLPHLSIVTNEKDDVLEL